MKDEQEDYGSCLTCGTTVNSPIIIANRFTGAMKFYCADCGLVAMELEYKRHTADLNKVSQN